MKINTNKKKMKEKKKEAFSHMLQALSDKE